MPSDTFQEYAPRVGDAYVDGTLTEGEMESALDYLGITDDGPRVVRKTLRTEFGLSRVQTLPNSLTDATPVQIQA